MAKGYDGSKILSALSGLSRAEIIWMFNRMKVLYREGKSPEQVKTMIEQEAKTKPWE